MKFDGYQRGMASMVYKFLDKKARDTTTQPRTRIISEDQQLANELHKPITTKLQRDKVNSS